MAILLVIGGLVLLFGGGEALVRGSVGVARRFGVSELVIGLTLVGFGTSAPELVTSLRAIQSDAVGISLGNVAGSNIANALLVVGVAALIRPILATPQAIGRDFSAMAVATGVFALLVVFDQFGRATGVALVAALAAYIVASLLMDRRQDRAAQLHAEEGESIETPGPLVVSLLLALAGLAGVVFGARFLVDGATSLARAMGVSDAVIGLSVVAVGTSLPELATSSISALRGKSDVALGNIIGSNIFNVFGILGVTAIVHPFSIMGAGEGGEAPVLTQFDLGAVLASAALLWLFAFTGRRIGRREASLLLAAYAGYMALVFG